MKRASQFLVLLVGTACSQPGHACSWVPTPLEDVAASQAIAIGKVVGEDIRESSPGDRHYRSRSVFVEAVEPLKGSIPHSVESTVACGADHPAVGSRVIVYRVEPGHYAFVEPIRDFERRLRERLGLPSKPPSPRRSHRDAPM
jgi:hypothetical protein